MSMRPTKEQEHCIEQFKTGKKLRINAYAGCGKTTVLKQLSRSTRRRGLYLSFNSSIASEARKEFPTNVECKTTHSLAFQSIKRRYTIEKMTGKINAGFVSMRMRYPGRHVARNFPVTSRGWAFLVLSCVQTWLRSGRPELSVHDVVFSGKFLALDAGTLSAIASQVLNDAFVLWEQMSDPRSDMPMTHDGYLKLWALAKPMLPGDFILLDEAQDTNGVVLRMILHQQAQVVCVGDRHQQIYEWRGAVNAMNLLPTEIEARLSTSFRFGTALADNASRILSVLGETVPLTGNPQRISSLGMVDKPNAILARTNVRLLEEAFALIGEDKKPCIVGGVDEILRFLTGAQDLMNYRPVFMPIELLGFSNWDEVRQTCEMEGESAADLRRWVKLIDDYGIDNLRRTLQGLPNRPDNADVVLSTAHKSKGLEWPAVRLCEDFLSTVRSETDNQNKKALAHAPLSGGVTNHAPELRLFYVAATRAMQNLEIHPALEEKLAKAAKEMAELANAA